MKLPEVYQLIQTKIHKTLDYYREFGLWKTILRFFESSGVFKKRELVFLEMDLKDSISAQEHKPRY